MTGESEDLISLRTALVDLRASFRPATRARLVIDGAITDCDAAHAEEITA